ncbi:MAG: primosomal protein N' [Clostridiales bacterium]|nr:primosomal protein N' [Clostridiales bacterium]
MEQVASIGKIAVSAATYAIDRPYDYLVPPALEGALRPGMRCAVPFGRGNRTCDGIVLALGQREDTDRLKSVLALLDEEPLLDGGSLRLALWMREHYFCTVYDAMRAMLPAGLWFSLKDCWRVAPGVDREAAYGAAGESKRAQKLVELLFAGGGWAEEGKIRTAFGVSNPGPALRDLEAKGIVVREASAQRGVGDKQELVAALAMDAGDAMALLAPKRRRAPLQYAAGEAICAAGETSAKELCYFTGASMATLHTLERMGVLTLSRREVYRRPQTPVYERAAPVELNGEQEAAYEGLLALTGQGGGAALLYGVTGSGKTQVYLKLIHTLLERGKTALVMVPEIALTPQLMRIFTSHFGHEVAILHSSLSAGERCDEWKRARRGEARVVVGTRSAVFAPLPDLGVIILDEEQEPSYKSEQNPRYHAREVARYRCHKAGALLLLGSATPSIETMYRAKQGEYRLFELRERYNEQALPQVAVVDMKDELRRGNGGAISAPLAGMLEETIDRGEQAILFLNRRGASRMVTCGECGETPTCPRCSVHLTYHSANRRLMCHYCGWSQPLPDRCPSCGGLLDFVGAGTQKVEEELNLLFPGTKVLRMDADTVSAVHSHESILEKFRKERVPILLGTQMVAKGLDFENVTLVGAVSADQLLYTGDIHAPERAFSLLTQVVGRAGRGEKAGRAVIQTFTPDNDVIQFAARQDYDSFYEQEIGIRRLRGLPPLCDLFVLCASGLEETAVLRALLRLRDALSAALRQEPYAGTPHRLLGPAPAAVAKVNDRYRYRLILNTQNTKAMRLLTAHLLRQAQADKQNRGVALFADLNPLD